MEVVRLKITAAGLKAWRQQHLLRPDEKVSRRPAVAANRDDVDQSSTRRDDARNPFISI